jgi:hypothetical protein
MQFESKQVHGTDLVENSRVQPVTVLFVCLRKHESILKRTERMTNERIVDAARTVRGAERHVARSRCAARRFVALSARSLCRRHRALKNETNTKNKIVQKTKRKKNRSCLLDWKNCQAALNTAERGVN